MKHKICFYTSTRAEYGLLKNVLYHIRTDSRIELQILASGTHLSSDFGMTIDEIKADGFEPDEMIDIQVSSDTPAAICQSMGLAMAGYGEAIQRLKPDMAVVLGDRFETFCMAASAQICRIPLAHIHGGETTEGSVDEAFRHSITKMSHLHFTSCEAYRRRVIQLGEAPDRVFNVGSLGVENIRRMALMDRRTLAESIGFPLEKPYFLVTFHPVTLENMTSECQFQSLLHALDSFPEYDVIFTKANADLGGRIINHLIEEYAQMHPERCLAVSSLGAERYLSAMKHAAAVIGNSSSGIIETPSFKIPTINIGDRQKGRIKAESVIDCEPSDTGIQRAIQESMSQPFQQSLSATINPFDRPGTTAEIASIIAKIDPAGLLKKAFYNIPPVGPHS